MERILNLKNINTKNQYEVDLNRYNGTKVKVLVEYENSFEIETYDGSEYTIFKNELL